MFNVNLLVSLNNIIPKIMEEHVWSRSLKQTTYNAKFEYQDHYKEIGLLYTRVQQLITKQTM